jgi:hypothetical protein
MSTSRAVIAGIVGALAITLVTALLRAMGMPVNFELVLGSMFTATIGMTTWLLGFLIHLSAGAMFGAIYAAMFQRWTRRADATTGVGIGAVHALFSGLALGTLPSVHPLVPEQLAAPGIFFVHLGAGGVIVYIGLHLLFGAVVGAMYAAEHRAHEPAGAYP